MPLRKLNCWEFKQCGRNPEKPNGTKNPCPALSETRLDGVHGGINAGRACWVVAGTMCKGEPQGDFALKISDCSSCEFYDYVKSQEEDSLLLTITLLKKLESEKSDLEEEGSVI